KERGKGRAKKERKDWEGGQFKFSESIGGVISESGNLGSTRQSSAWILIDNLWEISHYARISIYSVVKLSILLLRQLRFLLSVDSHYNIVLIVLLCLAKGCRNP